jgi:hypothetical protein
MPDNNATCHINHVVNRPNHSKCLNYGYAGCFAGCFYSNSNLFEPRPTAPNAPNAKSKILPVWSRRGRSPCFASREARTSRTVKQSSGAYGNVVVPTVPGFSNVLVTLCNALRLSLPSAAQLLLASARCHWSSHSSPQAVSQAVHTCSYRT